MNIQEYCKENKILNKTAKIVDCISTIDSSKVKDLIGKQGQLMIVGYKIMIVGIVTTEMVYNIVKNGNLHIVSCEDRLYTIEI